MYLFRRNPPKEPSPQKPTPDPYQRYISKKNLIVIIILWAPEIVYAVEKQLEFKFVEWLSIEFNLAESDAVDIVLSCATCLVLIVVGLASDRFEYTYVTLLIGLYISVLAPILGMLSLLKNGTADLYAMMWAKLGWYATVPVRFWLIFHQTFPISIDVTHYIVSGNVCVIMLAEWICIMFLPNGSADDDEKFLQWWVIIAAAAITLLLATHLIVTKLNNEESDDDAVRIKYGRREDIASFDFRQERKTAIFFLLLIYTGWMFSVVKMAAVTMMKEMNELVFYSSYWGIARCRLDLPVAIITILCLELVLYFLRRMRNEMNDLLVIVLAHSINIVTVVFLLFAVWKNADILSSVPVKHRGTIEIYYPAKYADITFKCDGIEAKGLSARFTQLILPVEGSKFVRCLGFFNEGSNIFEESLLVREKMRTVYVAAPHFGINRTRSIDRWMPTSHFRVIFMTLYEVCPHDDKFINLSNACVIDSCSELAKFNFEAFGDSVETVLLSRTIHLADGHSTSKSIDIPPETKSIKFSYPYEWKKMENLIHYFGGNKPDKHFWPVEKTIQVEGDPTVIILFISSDEQVCVPMPSEQYVLPFRSDSVLIAPTIFLGLASGLAAVSYLHFIWIQCPLFGRATIIAAFFAADFFFGWLTRTFMAINATSVLIILIFQSITTVFQFVMTFLYWSHLKLLREEEAVQKQMRRF